MIIGSSNSFASSQYHSRGRGSYRISVLQRLSLTASGHSILFWIVLYTSAIPHIKFRQITPRMAIPNISSSSTITCQIAISADLPCGPPSSVPLEQKPVSDQQFAHRSGQPTRKSSCAPSSPSSGNPESSTELSGTWSRA
jgi:hypothetical protein